MLDMRRAYQTTMRTDLVTGIESVVGHRVIAFLSANHIDPDISVETFVLDLAATTVPPVPTGGPARPVAPASDRGGQARCRRSRSGQGSGRGQRRIRANLPA